MKDAQTLWMLDMQNTTAYLSIQQMLSGMAYAIWARNAYVGIWLPEEQGFLISRYKLSDQPYLFVEHHWDTGSTFFLGTAKPLRPIKICPLILPPNPAHPDAEQELRLCAWLDALETTHPPLPGWDSVNQRRQAGQKWHHRQEMQRQEKDKLLKAQKSS